MRNIIAIVGGGFSGTVLAANLLRNPPAGATNIVLIERGGEMGRGVAYAERDYPYLLNVPAVRLSADSADPLQFLRFAQRRLPLADGEDFLPRSLYGDYLQDALLRAERQAPAHVQLQRIFGEVRRIAPLAQAKGLTVQFDDRAPLAAGRVVLALGNPASPPQPWAEAVVGHGAFRQDPWNLPKTLGNEHSVLIIGSGLTMVDIASALTHGANGTPQLHTISRHGVIPQPQTRFRAADVPGDLAALLECGHSVRRLLAMARELARKIESEGGDWREAVTFLRHLAPSLWQRLPAAEQRRFLRHVRTHWDSHRHRMPPQVGDHIAALRRAGKLRVNAGRIESIVPQGQQLRVTWRARGGGPASLTVDLVVNATGPEYALKRCADPLLTWLRREGLVAEDPLNLGLLTGQYGACVDAQGTASEALYYLGPMLRAQHWEATAATELRDHAEVLARHLAGVTGFSTR
jgi:uncharacterized NAD(P)/FAD-binding protein YdhS